MKILVYEVGVIGTFFATRLADNGHQVTVLARGQRLADIRRHGLVIEDVLSGERTATVVDAYERLGPDDRYDFALIIVRRDQLASVMPELIANPLAPTLLFMLNNPVGSAELLNALGDRVMLGFPGAGGMREGHVIRYAMIAQQPTMLGELGGTQTSRLQSVARIFRASGFKTRTYRDMDGWLKSACLLRDRSQWRDLSGRRRHPPIVRG